MTEMPEQQFDTRKLRPTPFAREVMQHEKMCQSLMGTSSLVHRDWFFHATKIMGHMEEEIRQLHITVNRLDEQAGRPPRFLQETDLSW